MAETEQTEKKATVKTDFVREISVPTAVLAAASDGDQSAFLACFDGTILRLDLPSGKHQVLARHGSYASGIQYLPRRGLVISSGYDGKLNWFDLAASKTIRTIAAHQFWSWQLHASPDESLVASSTGQYLAGGYKYEPAAGREPSVTVFEVESGKLRWSFPHTPPVQAVAFSPDSRHLAAGNMMGEVKVWNLETGREVSSWKTDSFTSWGIIKSHHYIGGIFDLCFSPDGRDVLVCGMGPMIDPMAGNGKQRWERFTWADGKQNGRIRDSDGGNGLMESIQFRPTQPIFVMAGRLAQGKWNTAFFEPSSGQMLHSLDTKMRVTDTLFSRDGSQLVLAGAISQERKKNGKCPDFGRLKIYRIAVT